MAIDLGVNAYIERDVLIAWMESRNYDYTSYTDEQIDGAIVISGSDFIDVNYTFKGEPLADTQAMQLPTDEVSIADIEKGAAQAAWQQLTGVLFVDQSTQSANGQIKMQRDKLDKLETEVEYTEGTQSTYTLSTQTIDRLLKPYIVGQSGYARVLL